MFLGLASCPFHTAYAGIVGSCIFMAFTAFLSSVSMIWLVEVCGRAEGLLRSKEEDQLDSPMLKSFGSREENEGVYAFRISKRRLEVNELTQIVLGTIPNYIYTASVTLFSISSMWFYGVIFSLSFTQTLPLPFYKDTYHVWHHGSSCNFNEGWARCPRMSRDVHNLSWLFRSFDHVCCEFRSGRPKC